MNARGRGLWTLRAADKVAENAAWSSRIRGLLAFFNERTDIYVDGERQDRPQTAWSQ